MKPQKWLGAALATTVAGALVLGVQGPSYTAEDLNANRIRRWYADCPRYDDSE